MNMFGEFSALSRLSLSLSLHIDIYYCCTKLERHGKTHFFITSPAVISVEMTRTRKSFLT